MKILFIRHAEAVEREEWTGDDMTRPLTDKGKRSALAMAEFHHLPNLLPGRVVSSEAIRAKETAAIFARGDKAGISPLLNPGCTMGEFRKLLKKYGKAKFIAVVGHEPDFSAIIAQLIGDGAARIKMAKASCAIVELGDDGGRLLTLVSPAMIGSFPMIGKKRARKFQALENNGGRKRGAK